MFGQKKSLRTKARDINTILVELGISEDSTNGKQLREIIALELLGENHPTLAQYSKMKFAQSGSTDDVKKALALLQMEGLLKPKQALELSEKVEGKK